jgi:superfamily I DNA/RNA helicase
MTNTWRFGPGTAEQVNLVLGAFKPNESARVVGRGEDRPWNDAIATTYLARTNAQLFEMAVAHVESRTDRIYWVGGIQGYRVHMLNDAYALWEGRVREIQDEWLRRFSGWEELRQYAESTQDPDARILHALVERYEHRIPDLVERIDAQVSETLEGAAIGLGTGHRGKGLEFPQVELCADFDKSFERALTAFETDQFGVEEEQEINLLYVALSRAQYCVRPNPGLMAWMEQERDRLAHARSYAERASTEMRDRP